MTTDVCFLRLTLTDKHGKKVSENMYVVGKEENNYQAFNRLPQATIQQSVERVGDTSMSVTVKNTSKVPALMIRLNLKGSDGEQILPVHYSDNCFHLMPGEVRKIDVSWKKEDTKGKEVSMDVNIFPYPVQ